MNFYMNESNGEKFFQLEGKYNIVEQNFKLTKNNFYREPPILQAHNNSDIILRLPMGKRIRDIRWLSVWCRRFTVSQINLIIM